MNTVRHVLSCILLASVVLALGDAPYVDELFDALARHGEQAQRAAPTRAPGQETDTSRTLRIYHALATIFTASSHAALPADADARRYFALSCRFPASADPSGIDRPPAPFAA